MTRLLAITNGPNSKNEKTEIGGQKVTIPDYQSCMLPLLKFASDRKELSLRETVDILGDHFGLSEGELKELLPSGKQAVFLNRIGWAKLRDLFGWQYLNSYLKEYEELGEYLQKVQNS